MTGETESISETPTVQSVTRFFPRKLLQWVGPLVAVTLIAAILGILVASLGLLAFPASVQDPQGLTDFVHGSFQRMVDHHSDDIAVPKDLDAAWRVQIGAAHFAQSCAACHGEPDRGQNPIVLSMRPRPQYLPAVVGGFSAPQLFWIVKHGVKFSGMPAWPTQKRDDEVWSLVAFLRAMKGMNAHQYTALAYAPEAADKVPAVVERYPYAEHNSLEYPRDEHSYSWPAAALRHTAGGDDTCDACHGEDGAGRPMGEAPNLTIQTPEYLSAALRSFASGARPSGIMQTIATSMSAAEQDGAAKYFGGKGRASPERSGAITAKAGDRAGYAIAVNGIPSRHIAACTSCHGVEGASKVGFPVIAGQNQRYLAQQMLLFRTGGRGRTEGYDPMSAEAHHLTDAEILAVSRYYSSLAPGTKPVSTTVAPEMAATRRQAAP